MNLRPFTRALILEDLEVAQQWLKGALELAFPGIKVRIAASLAEGRRSLLPLPDIALIDLKLPDGDGIELLREIKGSGNPLPCIVTTIYDDDRHLFPALTAGADGYLLKDHDQEDLANELQRILVGQPPLSPGIARRVLSSFTPSTEPLVEPLTPRQLQVLRMIAQGRSIQQVADELSISYHTAASHIRGIYQRLGVTSRAEATARAIKLGLDT